MLLRTVRGSDSNAPFTLLSPARQQRSLSSLIGVLTEPRYGF
jgi:hypothetical protein